MKYPTMTCQQITLPAECVPPLNLLLLTGFEPLFQTVRDCEQESVVFFRQCLQKVSSL